ncbi:MAG: hypothetical protein LBS60_12925 [Deltaproteobacteria bacterium]|jgi:hypothetical protein|nr:hypothetical protein [Deltaproteobacteria bacterium]
MNSINIKNYLSELDDEEIRFVCSNITLEYASNFFKHNNKAFAKDFPGFRTDVNSLQRLGEDFIFKKKNLKSVSSLINTAIDHGIEVIKDYYDLYLKLDDNKDKARLKSIAHTTFSENIHLYFKLVGESYSEEYSSLFSAAMSIIDTLTEKAKKSAELAKENLNEITQLKNINANLLKKLDKYNELMAINKDFELKNKRLTGDISILNSSKIVLDEQIKSLTVQLDEKKNLIKKLGLKRLNTLELIKKLRDNCSSQKKGKIKVPKGPKGPQDIQEFIQYLGYNFQEIGVLNDCNCFDLLLKHISNILFLGIPIVITKSVEHMFIKCLANTLIGTQKYDKLSYSDRISDNDIKQFLDGSGRIVCLDNFVGNYNETKLISLFDSYRHKIIFLTVCYNRTLNFVPKEFLSYVQYLNIDRIGSFSNNKVLDEDPSTIDEIDYTPSVSKTLFSTRLSDIMTELGFPNCIVERKSSIIQNEDDFCGALIFEALPYCADVLQKKPYVMSERFVKYSNKPSCPYKDLIYNWFIK